MTVDPDQGISPALIFQLTEKPYSQNNSIAGFPVLREAVAAVDRSALRRLERNFALFATVRTDCLMELAGAVLVRAGTPARISLIHVLQPCR